MADKVDILPDLARLLDAALRAGWNALSYVDRLVERLGLEPSGGPEAAEKALRKALGLKACQCGIAPGAPSEVIPLACPVHGTPCSSCGGLESCKPDCNGEDPEELLAAIDEAEVIGTVTDALGDFVKVGVVRLAPVKPAVLIGVSGSPGILDTPERRDEFARYYMEACRQAEAVEAAQAAGTEGQ